MWQLLWELWLLSRSVHTAVFCSISFFCIPYYYLVELLPSAISNSSHEAFILTQGGLGPAGLSAEDLHVLDLTQQRPRWHRFGPEGCMCEHLIYSVKIGLLI